MKKGISLLAIALLSCSLQSFAQVSNDNEDGVYKVERHDQRAFRQGEVIVKFKTGSASANLARKSRKISAVSAVSKVMAELGATEFEPLMPLSGELSPNMPRKVKAFNGKDIEIKDMTSLYTIRFDAAKQQNVFAVVEQLQALDDVEFAEPNYLVYATATGDGDNYKKDPLEKNQWERTAINIYNLWNTPKITSKRPVIAILDTGVDITHPDLADNIWTNTLENEGAEDADDDANGFKDDIHGWDFVNQTGHIRDNNGHGTHCAGIAAAVGGNGIGLAGANPDAYIMPITVMQSDGTGDVATIIKGIDYAAANGADVISMSLGGYNHSMAEEQALAHAYATAVLVAAAGNDGYCMNHADCNPTVKRPMPMFPAAYTFVLGVQATQNSGSTTGFSNYDDDGPFFSSYGEEQIYNYELKAPGANIVSTFPGGKYKALNGTSMACPLVAGAISRLMQCKELGSKEELFGDLINSTTAAGNLDIYKAYQMSDANRRPTLNLITYNIDDAAGDGDGRPDAGETLDIYPVLRNAWGSAKNIRVSIELAETEDPEIVEIINGTADFGFDLSSYGKATSANPLRIKLNGNCADGRHICMVIKATCDNVTSIAEQDVVLKAENGVEIGGMITEDTTLPEGTYIVTRPLAVPAGVTLTIEPGAVLKFKDGTGLSVVYNDKYRNVYPGGDVNFAIFYEIDRSTSGRLKMCGTPEKRIVLTTAEGNNGDWTLNFGSNGGAFLHKRYYMNEQTIYDYFDKEGLDFDQFSYVEISNMNASTSQDRIYSGIFDNSIIHYCGGFRLAEHGLFRKCNFTENTGPALFYYTTGYFINSNIANNNNMHGEPKVDFDYYRTCNLLPTISDILDKSTLALYTTSPVMIHTNSPSYLGSSKEDIARQWVWDIEHDYGFGYFDLSNMLTRPSAEAHGIVWKVVVNGKDAQDEFEELAPLGVGTHKFEVYFNRPMNKDVVPTISMGVRPPYTSISIAEEGENSGWNAEGTIYTAYLTINGKTNADGLNRIRVYGAEDDEYFEIPEEKYRFNVMVQKAGSMSTGLMATEGLGKVTLNWETAEEDFADLMGYNVYRYHEYEKEFKGWCYDENGKYGNWDKIVTLRDTIQVNQTLIDPSETELVDYDVVPGTTYYYMVKEMGTDLQQHDVSNVVAATPLTAQKGDANGSMTVDVADVVTEVNYLTNQNPQPFIFEAADVNSDNAVNILDVVGTVNLIFRPDAVGTESVDNTATYFVNDGILYVDTPTSLGGAQVSIAAPQGTEFEVLEGLNGMEQASFWQNDNAYMLLAYSMSGKYIPMGVQPLLRVGDAEVTDMVLSDTRGHNVLAINNTATSIDTLPFGIDNHEGAEVRYYDLSGRTISRRQAHQQGVYIQSIFVDGKCMKSYKVLK